jgi:DNA-binding transcriptional LysR family regulator
MSFMNETPASLDDLALFAAVAQHASLSAAQSATRISLPTLSRRMAALVRDLGRRLFQRGPKGYSLTAEGRALADELSGLADTRQSVSRWLSSQTEAGHGQIVLPTFVGDILPTLSRKSDVIDELSHESWLVSHHDARHDQPIRAVLGDISAILRRA